MFRRRSKTGDASTRRLSDSGGTSTAALTLLASLTAIALLLALAAFIAFSFLFYTSPPSNVDELEQAVGSQSQRVADLEQTDKRILSEHSAIGKQFAEQTSDLRSVLTIVRPTQTRLSARRSTLMRFARRGFLTPQTLPRSLAIRRARIAPYRDGYGMTWPRSVSLFASTTRAQPLQLLISLAAADRRTIVVRQRRVIEIRRSPLLFAWTTGRKKYTVLAPPPLREAAVALIAGMR